MWLDSLFASWKPARRRRAPQQRRLLVYTPILERLEDRITPVAFTPFQIRAAYGISSIPTFGSQPADGTGQAIAIMDEYNDPNIIADLNAFDQSVSLTGATATSTNSLFAQYGAASTSPTSFLQVFNQSGTNITASVASNTSQNTVNGVPGVDPSGPGSAGSWEVEESLDVEWAHAIAPGAEIDLFECNPPSSLQGPLAGVRAAIPAATGLPEVSVVSISAGSNEYENLFTQETADDSYFIQPSGVTFLASTGDSGSPGGYPAFSPDVLAVGGTTLNLNPITGAYQSETAWIGSGGGVSQVEPLPSYQVGIPGAGNMRTIPDVSFDGDPNTGVVIVDTYDNQSSVAGTSLSSPCWAGLIAIANQGRVLAGEAPLNSFNPQQTMQILYGIGSNPTQYAQDFNDVTTGSNQQVTGALMVTSAGGVSLVGSGSGYSQAPLTVNLGPAGGQNAVVTFTTSFGQVTNASIAQPGTGYMPTAGLPITGAGGAGAVGRITSVSPTGAITGFAVTAPGTGYLSVNFVGGGGSGATGIAIVNSAGAISNVVITNAGNVGYTMAPTVVFTGGGYNSIAHARALLQPGEVAHSGYDQVTGLGTPIANNLIPALVSAPTDLYGIYGNARLGQVSDQAPALGTVNNQSFIAFRGRENHQLCIIQLNPSGSTDNNVEYTNPAITVNDSPALATVNGQMYVAWSGDSGHDIYVAPVNIDGNGVISLGPIVDTGESTDDSPALAAFNGSLYVAWTGGGNLLNVMQLDDNLNPILPVYTSGATVNGSPALAASGGQLYVAWGGRTNNNELFVSTVVDNNGAPVVPPPTGLPETSGQAPALADLNGQLVIAWSGSGNRVLSAMILNTNGGISVGAKVANASDITNGGGSFSIDKPSNGPALLSENGFLWLAWNGQDGAGDLYVAPVSFTAQPIILQKLSLTLQVDSNDPNVLQVYHGGTLLNSYGIGTFNQIVEGGAPANAALTLNFINGNFIPSAGVLFGSSGDGALILENGAFTDELISPSGSNSGAIALDGSTITYSNATSIIDTAKVADLTVNGADSAGEQVNFVNDPHGAENGGVHTDEINSASGAFAKIDFGDKTNVTFQGGTGGDVYTIDVTTAASQLAALTVDGASTAGDAFDALATAQGAPVSINSGSGASTVYITPINEDLDKLAGAVTVNGGVGGTTFLVIDDQHDPNSETYTWTDATFGSTNSAEIGYTNVNSVVVNGGTGPDNELAILQGTDGGQTWTATAATQAGAFQVQGSDPNNMSIPPVTASGIETLSIDAPTTVDANGNPLTNPGGNTYDIQDLTGTGIKNVDVNLHEASRPDANPDTITVNGTSTGTIGDEVQVEDLAGSASVEQVALTELVKETTVGVEGTGSGSSSPDSVTYVPALWTRYTVTAAIPNAPDPAAGSSGDSLTVNTYQGNNQVVVDSTAGGGSTYVNTGAGGVAGGANAITVGSANSPAGLDTIQGPLFINAGNGLHNSLRFTEASAGVGDTLTLTNDALIRYSTTPMVAEEGKRMKPETRYAFQIFYQATGANGSVGAFGAGIELDATKGPDTVYVPSTTANTRVTINTGVNSANTNPPTPDQVFVGYDAGDPDAINPRNASTLDQILSPVSVTGAGATGTPATELFIEDQGAAQAQTYSLEWLSLPGVEVLQRTGAAAIGYWGRDLAMTLDAGSQGNQFNVQGVLAGTSAAINAGNGANTFAVGDLMNNLSGIRGLLTLNGGAGANNVTIRDEGAGVAETYRLSASQLARAANAHGPALAVDFSNMTSLDFKASDLPATVHTANAVMITGAAANTATEVDTAHGVNKITVLDLDMIHGSLDLSGLAGATNGLLVDDSTSAAMPGSYILSPGSEANGTAQVMRSGAAIVTYANMEIVGLDVGKAAGDSVNVTPSQSTAFVLKGNAAEYNAGHPDMLAVDLGGVTTPTLQTAAHGSGTWMFGNAKAIAYSEFQLPAPTVASIAPSIGPVAGHTAVTITGANFLGATRVSFGGASALSFTVNSLTQITAISPPHAAGSINVTVTVGGATTSAVVAADQFTFGSSQGPGTPTILVTDAGGTYNGSQYPATATATGSGGAAVSGTFTYEYIDGQNNESSNPPTAAGTYSVNAYFTSTDPDYSGASGTTSFTISSSGPSTPTVQVSAASGPYTGEIAAVTATVTGTSGIPGSTLEGVGLGLEYYQVLPDGTLNPLGFPPTTVGSYEVVATFGGSTDYTSASSQPAPFTISVATPNVSPPTSPVSIIYGAVLANAQLSGLGGGATITVDGQVVNVPGSFGYAGGDGVLLSVGQQSEPIIFYPTDATDFSTVNNLTVLVDVAQATPQVTVTPVTIPLGTMLINSQLSGSATAMVNGVSTTVAGTYTYTSQEGATPDAGTQTEAVTFVPTSADFAVVVGSVQVTVEQETPTITLTSSLNPAGFTQQVTFTATLQAAVDVPQGTVTFYNGTQVLATEMLQNFGKQVTFTTRLSPGTYAITAVYTDTVDNNFTSATSAVLEQTWLEG